MATRKMYLTNPAFSMVQAPRPHNYATGDRQQTRSFSHGPKEVSGSFSINLSAEESLEWLLAALDGAVTPTTPAGFTNGRQWVFKPGNTVASMACEYHDGANLWLATGVMVDQLTFAGSVTGENTLSGALFGADLLPLGALATLTDRIPEIIEGWETRVAIDPAGGTPGSNIIAGQVLNWNAALTNSLGRKYYADNTLRTGGVVTGVLGVTGALTLEAAGPQAMAEFNNWNNTVKRLVRLEFGNNSVIDVGTNEVQTVTITGTPTGGTFTLTVYGNTTAPIPYNATAAQVLAALNALPNVGPGQVTVAGGPLPGAAVTVTFTGSLGGRNVNQMTAAGSFVGGTAPAVAVTTTTPGVGSRRAVYVDLPCYVSAVNLGGNDAGTRTYELALQPIYDPTLAAMIAVTVVTDRLTAF